MTLVPDVPLIVVVIHIVALVAFLIDTVATNRQRLTLIRQNRPDVQDPL